LCRRHLGVRRLDAALDSPRRETPHAKCEGGVKPPPWIRPDEKRHTRSAKAASSRRLGFAPTGSATREMRRRRQAAALDSPRRETPRAKCEGGVKPPPWVCPDEKRHTRSAKAASSHRTPRRFAHFHGLWVPVSGRAWATALKTSGVGAALVAAPRGQRQGLPRQRG